MRSLKAYQAMKDQPSLFIFVTASGRCQQIGELISGSIEAGWRTYTVATPNVAEIVAPEQLFTQPGVHWISGYEQPPLEFLETVPLLDAAPGQAGDAPPGP